MCVCVCVYWCIPFAPICRLQLNAFAYSSSYYFQFFFCIQFRPLWYFFPYFRKSWILAFLRLCFAFRCDVCVRVFVFLLRFKIIIQTHLHTCIIHTLRNKRARIVVMSVYGKPLIFTYMCHACKKNRSDGKGSNSSFGAFCAIRCAAQGDALANLFLARNFALPQNSCALAVLNQILSFVQSIARMICMKMTVFVKRKPHIPCLVVWCTGIIDSYLKQMHTETLAHKLFIRVHSTVRTKQTIFYAIPLCVCV